MGSDSNGINNFHDGVERSTNNYLNKIFEISITNLFFFFSRLKYCKLNSILNLVLRNR